MQFLEIQNLKKKLKMINLLNGKKFMVISLDKNNNAWVKAINKDKTILLELDVKGAMTVKKLYPTKSLSFFVEPPSVEDLKYRLQKRSLVTNIALKILLLLICKSLIENRLCFLNCCSLIKL